MTPTIETYDDPCSLCKLYQLRIPRTYFVNIASRWTIKWRIGWWLLKMIWRAA